MGKITKKTEKPVAGLAPRPQDLKKLKPLLDKKIKAFTKEVKSETEKYGIIVDVTVFIQETKDNS